MTSRLGTGKRLTFFYSVYSALPQPYPALYKKGVDPGGGPRKGGQKVGSTMEGKSICSMADQCDHPRHTQSHTVPSEELLKHTMP
jgi:hypothetical protein